MGNLKFVFLKRGRWEDETKKDGGVSVITHVVEKRCLQNFGRENLRQETTLESRTWMGDNVKDNKTEQVGRK